MSNKIAITNVLKQNLHPSNVHNNGYNFVTLIKTYPALQQFVTPNAYNNLSINYFNANAVIALNKALLMHYYGVVYWHIPTGYLCPPIPSRANYLHYLADLLTTSNNGKPPNGKSITVLDIGVGANCIYPILGNYMYNWQFIGTDTHTNSLHAAQQNINNNPHLKNNITLLLQPNPQQIFINIIKPNQRIAVTICNPPFYASAAEANQKATQKLRQLTKTTIKNTKLNFGGMHNELYTLGGELQFLKTTIFESKQFKHQCLWFTSLISKSALLPQLQIYLQQVNALAVKVIPMHQGNKISRILAWSFFTIPQQNTWAKQYWQ